MPTLTRAIKGHLTLSQVLFSARTRDVCKTYLARQIAICRTLNKHVKRRIYGVFYCFALTDRTYTCDMKRKLKLKIPALVMKK